MTGMPLNDATTTIQDAGFKLGLVTPQYDETVADGAVIEQYPGAGTMVEKGATISLVVSRGPSRAPSPSPLPPVGRSLVEVPDVVTMLQADAEASLTGQGFASTSSPAECSLRGRYRPEARSRHHASRARQ